MRRQWLFFVAREFQVLAGEILTVPSEAHDAAVEAVVARIPPATGAVETQLLAYWIERARRHPVVPAAAPRPLAHRMRSYIDEHLDDALDLRSLAARFTVSPRILASAFRREYGSSVRAYTTARRLDMAATLLAQGEKVEAVARCVGFASRNTLYRLIRQHAGATLAQLRDPSHRAAREVPPDVSADAGRQAPVRRSPAGAPHRRRRTASAGES